MKIRVYIFADEETKLDLMKQLPNEYQAYGLATDLNQAIKEIHRCRPILIIWDAEINHPEQVRVEYFCPIIILTKSGNNDTSLGLLDSVKLEREEINFSFIECLAFMNNKYSIDKYGFNGSEIVSFTSDLFYNKFDNKAYIDDNGQGFRTVYFNPNNLPGVILYHLAEYPNNEEISLRMLGELWPKLGKEPQTENALIQNLLNKRIKQAISSTYDHDSWCRSNQSKAYIIKKTEPSISDLLIKRDDLLESLEIEEKTTCHDSKNKTVTNRDIVEYGFWTGITISMYSPENNSFPEEIINKASYWMLKIFDVLEISIVAPIRWDSQSISVPYSYAIQKIEEYDKEIYQWYVTISTITIFYVRLLKGNEGLADDVLVNTEPNKLISQTSIYLLLLNIPEPVNIQIVESMKKSLDEEDNSILMDSMIYVYHLLKYTSEVLPRS